MVDPPVDAGEAEGDSIFACHAKSDEPEIAGRARLKIKWNR